jgi:oligoendopeptidase F
VTVATAVPKRHEVPREHTWNVESIYANDDLWEVDYARVEAMLPELEKLAGTLAAGPEPLLHAIRQIHEAESLLSQVMVYAFLRRDEDTTHPTYQAFAERTSSLGARFGGAVAFFEPEVLAIPDEQIDSFLQTSEDLRLYTHFLAELRRQRAHVRSAEVEAVLAAAGEVTRAPSNVFSMLNDADLKFPTIRDEQGNDIEVTKGRYIRLMESKDRRVRKDAFEALYSKYSEHRNTIAATLSGSVRRDIFEARVRGYESSLQAALQPNAIPLEVYHNLVDTVNKNLHHYQRYLRLRRKFLGLDELHMYDLYVPLVPGATIEIDYDEARETVEKALAPLGSEYIDTMHAGLHEHRWVDIYENEGKRGGAYSSGSYTTQPFILMNYQNNLNNMYTLAHELGHSMHSHLTRASQPYVYGQYTIFVAEVASTLNEALLTRHLLQHADERALRLQIVNQQLDEYRSTLYRQTMFAEFELEIHRRAEAGEALTADSFTAIYTDLLKRYFGDEVVLDEPIRMEWARIPHFYRAFYVYQYATGITAATALAEQIMEEGQPAVERYLGFLRGGSSKVSIDLLRGAGVDMTSPEPVERALGFFGRLVDQFEELLQESDNGQSADT